MGSGLGEGEPDGDGLGEAGAADAITLGEPVAGDRTAAFGPVPPQPAKITAPIADAIARIS